MLSVGPEGPTDLRVDFGLFPVVVLVGIDFREAGFDGWSRRSLQTFPEDLVVEFGWNAVFSREVEASGFRRPVLRVMSRLQLGTGGEHDLFRVQSQSPSL